MPHLGHCSSVRVGWCACLKESLVRAVTYGWASAKAMGLTRVCCFRVKDV